MTKKGYDLVDDPVDLRLTISEFHNEEISMNAIVVNEENLTEYLDYHKNYFNYGYWNAERIKEKYSSWILFMIKDKELVTGGLFRICGQGNPVTAEIFGVKGPNEDMVYDLICAGVNKSLAMNQKIRKIIFMAEDTMGEQATKRAGFSIKNRYCCWHGFL